MTNTFISIHPPPLSDDDRCSDIRGMSCSCQGRMGGPLARRDRRGAPAALQDRGSRARVRRCARTRSPPPPAAQTRAATAAAAASTPTGPPRASAGDSSYAAATATQTTKRGFPSERAARDARRRLIEQVERGEVRHTKETFGGYWERWLARRRPYLEAGTWRGYEIDGRKRLLPAFGPRSLGELSVDDIREFVAELAEQVEAGELAAKTVNNALGTLVVCLNAAVEDGLIATNPALRVGRLPAGSHRAGLPAPARDPALPRLVLGRLPPARRGADRQRAADLRGAGAAHSATSSSSRPAGRSSSTARASATPSARRSLTASARSRSARRLRASFATSLQRVAPSWPQDTAPKSVLFVMPVRTRNAASGRWESAGVAGAAGPHHRLARLAQAGARGCRAPRHAAARAAAHRRGGVARRRKLADVRAAPAWARRHRHDRALLRPPRAPRARGRRGCHRGSDRPGVQCGSLEQRLLSGGRRRAPRSSPSIASWPAVAGGVVITFVCSAPSRCPTGPGLPEPPVEVLWNEPQRPILTANSHRWDPPCPRRLVYPRARDRELASDVGRLQQIHKPTADA